jgi:hypothetical protein
MNIHQLSVRYLPEQDRILARANSTGGEEMQLWLTRRLMLDLWPLLSRLMSEHLLRLEAAGSSLHGVDEELKKMLSDYRTDQFLRHADFNTPYRDEPSALPRGEEPLLVTDVDAAPLPSGRLRLSFNERPVPPREARNMQLELEPRLMQGLLHLLEQALGQSKWREPFVAAREERGAFEGELRQARTRYLN